jgi:hypothetical protein
MASMPVIEAKGLTKHYGRSGSDRLHLSVEPDHRPRGDNERARARSSRSRWPAATEGAWVLAWTCHHTFKMQGRGLHAEPTLRRTSAPPSSSCMARVSGLPRTAARERTAEVSSWAHEALPPDRRPPRVSSVSSWLKPLSRPCRCSSATRPDGGRDDAGADSCPVPSWHLRRRHAPAGQIEQVGDYCWPSTRGSLAAAR